MHTQRRQFVRSVVALPAALLASRTSAQTPSCPPGTEMKMVKIYDEVATQEASMSLMGFSVSQKVPIRVRKIEVVCEKTPPPKPRPKLAFDDVLELDRTIEEQTLIVRDLGFFNMVVRFTNSLARVEVQAPTLVLEVLVRDRIDKLHWPLSWDGNARFRLLDPAKAATWAQTDGNQVTLRSLSVAGILGRSQAYGDGRFGYTAYLDRTPIFGATGRVVSRGQAPNMLNNQHALDLN